MKVATGSGDGGRTSLFSGERVLKDDERLEASGDLDELNAVIGGLVAALPPEAAACAPELRAVQSDLFPIGAWLSAGDSPPAAALLPGLDPEGTARLERAIARMEAELPELRSFLLPGGCPAAAWAHLARTVCRRAERRLVRLSRESAASPPAWRREALRYLNRLSDYFFVLARTLNRLAGVEETPWRRDA